MYLDLYVVSGIAIVVLMCIMMGYIGWYAYRQIQQDQGEEVKREQNRSDQ